MKELHEVRFDFRQNKFLRQLDPRVLQKSAVAIQKAKTAFHRQRLAELKREQQLGEAQRELLAQASGVDHAKAQRAYKRMAATLDKKERANGALFEQHAAGSNPRFFAPHFFNTGYGRTVGGVNTDYTWDVNFGGTSVPIPYADPTRGLMGVQISVANPGGNTYFTTGLANLFFSQSAQTIPLAAAFSVYGHGISFGFGLGYSRAWVRLGVEAWISGPARPSPAHFYFVDDFWSSVPSPWVTEDRHFSQTYGTPTHMISLLPADLLLGSAVIEQGAVCGGWLTGAKSAFLVGVSPLTIGP